jgi:putative ABC transport system substrate-binding protein
MRRREFITLFGGAAAWPLAARAQQRAKLRRIGILETTSPELNSENLDALRHGLQGLGYVEKQNYVLDSTATIPIVMAAIGEPLATGAVVSLARPGSNVTGLSAFVTELAGKRVELVKELQPGRPTAALFHNMGNPVAIPQWDETKKAAQALGIQVILLDVRTRDHILRAFETARARGVDTLLVGIDALIQENRQLIADLAAKHRLAAIYPSKEFTDVGGLMTYGVSYPELYFRSATLIEKIFRGAKPGDLPVEQPTRLELIINLKAAKAMDLVVPASLVTRADTVIE